MMMMPSIKSVVCSKGIKCLDQAIQAREIVENLVTLVRADQRHP
ncbi:Uncharacterised protein [uncultured archaeon]|nr:Uncharacterised protein [uncultured archaeon]